MSAPAGHDRHAAATALHWLRRHPIDRRDAPALPLADEAWFHAMLLERFSTLCPADVPAWEGTLNALLDTARQPASPAARQHPAAEADDLLGTAMLAHLLHVRAPGDKAARRLVERLAPRLRTASLPPLHALCLAHNLHELGEHDLAGALRPPRDADQAAAGLTGAERLLTQAYFHTHVVLFAFGTFRRPDGDPAPLAGSVRFLRRHAPAFARYGWADLCAEAALSLSLCAARDEDFRLLIAALHGSQRPEGDWTHPRVDARQARHATMMASLALLESARHSTAAARG
ncbi:hypothetical protein J7F01_11220 [Streptomyces sp. ISL-22]|uniref:hypothetical protein n=1 Tax=unclassified Streptomyces TaxID=2593676 RepID=UPI001BEA886C|nr:MULTISPECIES: hypothetical protein [unclassified Streptomyces]MBT2421108.1 hypothetical protein [Streptomyces sp. ISL-24]MBT2432751.1 hypothetical protein [Streptomyces sp. ISL-22]